MARRKVPGAEDDGSVDLRQVKSYGLLESIFGSTNVEASDWPTDPVQKARIFNTTTRPTWRLKYSLDANPMSHFEGDIDKIVDCLKLFIRQVRVSNVHILYALKRFFWALRILTRTVKARVERNREAAAKFVDWWTEKEEGLREEYYANILSTNYTLHHSVEESLAEFQKTCTPKELKEAVVRTLMYRRRVEYLRKRRLWRREYEAKLGHLHKLQQLYNTIYTRNSEPTEASEDHMKAIKEARRAVIACALASPTLVINHKNVSLEQLLNLCGEIQRKRARLNRDKLLDEWDRQRLAEKEARRQAFVKLALKREAERRVQLQEKRLKELQEQSKEDATQQDSQKPKHRGRFTTLALRPPDEEALEMSTLLKSVSYRPANDGAKFAERQRRSTIVSRGCDSTGDADASWHDMLSLSDAGPTLETQTVSPRRISPPRATRPDVRPTAFDHVVATTADLLRKSARPATSSHSTSTPLPALMVEADSSALIMLKAPSRSPGGTAASHLDEMAEIRRAAEQSAAQRHEERKRREHEAEVQRIVAQRPPAPPLPSFFASHHGTPAVTPFTVSTLHIGMPVRPRPLDLEVSTDGRLVDRKTAETRKQFAVHRFRAGVTRSVATPFGALTHVHKPLPQVTRGGMVTTPTPVSVTSTSLVLSAFPMAEHASFAAVSPRRGALTPTFMDHSRVLNTAIPARNAGESLSRLKPSFMTLEARHRCEETVRDLLSTRCNQAMSPNSTRQLTRTMGMEADDDQELDILHLGRVAL